MTESTSAYLEAQVMTAPPHKLHLMLIEGAMRFTQKSIQQLTSGEHLEAIKSISRAREIVSEVMVSFQTTDEQLSGRVRRIYLFLFRHLTDAQLDQDVEKLREVIRVLEAEADTWRRVCESTSASPAIHASAGQSSAPAPHISPSMADPSVADDGMSSQDGSSSSGGFSLEA